MRLCGELCRGQEDLWEDPEERRFAVPPMQQPTVDPSDGISPDVPAFNLEEELANLEKETKVKGLGARY